MARFVYPLIQTIWNDEVVPEQWNRGHITTLWKGKGDKEQLTNYRGITTSSSLGNIMEAVIDRRIQSTVPFTQAQGGGQKKASTYDHLFILRAIIDIAKKQKTPTYLTFYDVSKAYDHADNADMLSIIWNKGLRGKTWRILKKLNEDLTAIVKTRHGNTREVKMQIGGRQGSRLTGRLFSKMMDILAEELEQTELGITFTEDLKIATLLWVDDVLTCTNGEKNQNEILKKVDEFARKHKLRWGQSRCSPA